MALASAAEHIVLSVRIDLAELLANLKKAPAEAAKEAQKVSQQFKGVTADVDFSGTEEEAAAAAAFFKKQFDKAADEVGKRQRDASGRFVKGGGGGSAPPPPPPTGQTQPGQDPPPPPPPPPPPSGGEEFRKQAAAAKAYLEEQIALMAKMRLEGKQGSSEWNAQAEKIRAAKAEADKFDKALDEINRSFGQVPKNPFKLLNFASLVSGVGAVTSAVSTFQAPFVELDKQVKNIGTLGVANFEQFSDLALDLSKKVPDSASTIALAAYNAISAGISGTNEEIIGFVETAAKVAVAGVSDTNSAVNGLTSVLNAYKLGAAGAQQVSDTFFAAIKLGKTSFNEMNAGLANVIPAASAAGIQFDEVSAVIAQMTALGVPTAQATTQIRAAIIELQKPGAALAEVMGKVGLNSANIATKLKEQGLIATLQQVEQAATSMGKGMSQVFSSSEAGSAALLVTGDNAARANQTLEGVRKEIEAGAATAAFEVAAEGADVKAKAIINSIQAVASKAFAAIGEGGNAALAAATQLAPAVSSLVGLGSLVPDGAKTKVTEFFGAFKTGQGAMAGFKTSMASAGSAVTSFATGPMGVILIAAAIFTLLYQKSESFRAAVDKLIGTLGDSLGPIFEQIFGLVGPLLDQVLGSLEPIFTLLLELIGDLLTPLMPIIQALLQVALIPLKLIAQGIMLLTEPIKIVTAGIEGLVSAFKVVAGGIGSILGALFSGDVDGAIDGALNLGNQAGAEFMKGYRERLDANEIKEAVEDLGKATEEATKLKGKSDAVDSVQGLVEKYKNATDAVEKKQLGEILAKQLPPGVAQVQYTRNALGELEKQYTINTAAADKWAKKQKESVSEDLGGLQEDFLKGLRAQAQQYDTNKSKLDELAQQIEAKSKVGIDTADLQKEFDDLKGKVETDKNALVETYKNAKITGVFDNLSEESQAELGKLREGFGEALTDVESSIAQSGIEDALAKAATLKTDLDGQGKIEELVQKYKNASTELEKQSFAKAIADQSPEAITDIKSVVDESGKISTVYEISTEKALEMAAANKQATGQELQAQQAAFKDGLGQLGDQYNDTKARADEMAKKIVEGVKQGKDVSALRNEYARLQEKLGQNAQAIADNVQKGKQFGLIKGDVRGVGTEFGFTGDRAKAVNQAVARIPEGLDKAALSTDQLNEEFQRLQTEATNASNGLIGEAAALVVRLQDKTLAEAERLALEEQLKIARERAKSAVVHEKDMAKIIEAEQVRSGKKKAERKKTEARADIVGDEELVRARLIAQQELEKVQNELLKDVFKARSDLRLKEMEQEKELKDLREQLRVASANGEKKQAEELRTKIVERQKTHAIELQGLKNQEDAVILKAQQQLGVSMLSIIDETHKAELEARRQSVDKINLEELKTVEAVKDATAQRLAVIGDEERQKQLAVVQGSEEFKRAAQDQASEQVKAYINAQLEIGKAQEDLRAAEEAGNADVVNSTKERIKGLEANLKTSQDALLAKLAETRNSFLDSLLTTPEEKFKELAPELQSLVLQLRSITVGSDEQERKERDAAEKRELAINLEERRKAVIAASKDLREQEKNLALFDLEERLKEELKELEDNEEKKTEALRKAAAERIEIEEAYRKETDQLYRLSLNLQESLRDAFRNRKEEADQKELEKEREKLKEEEAALFESLKRREIGYVEYSKRQRELSEQLGEIEKQIQGEVFDIGEVFRQAGIISSTRFEEEQAKIRDEANKRYREDYDRARLIRSKGDKASVEELAELVEVEKRIQEDRTQIYVNFATSAIGQFLRLSAEGKNLGQAALAVLIDTALKYLEMMIPVWIAGIYGTSVAQLGPIGLGIATVSIGVLEGLAALARSQLKLRTGDVRIKGPGTTTSDSIPAWLSREESVINAASSMVPENERALRWMNDNPGRSITQYVAGRLREAVPNLTVVLQGMMPKLKEQIAGATLFEFIAPRLSNSLLLEVATMEVPYPALVAPGLVEAAKAQAQAADRIADSVDTLTLAQKRAAREERRKKSGNNATEVRISGHALEVLRIRAKRAANRRSR